MDFDKVLIPNSSTFQWGIVCDATNPDCELSGNEEKGTYDFGRDYKGLLGKLTLKLDKDQKDPEQKLDFVLVDKHEANWAPEKWAVLGFSPKSQFVQYLRNNTE